MLGGAGGGRDRSGVNLNIAKWTVSLYMWRTINLLVKLLPEYVCWPAPLQRSLDPAKTNLTLTTTIFQKCIGFLDGSALVLRYRPMVDPEAYYSRKSIQQVPTIQLYLNRRLYTSVSETTLTKMSSSWLIKPMLLNVMLSYCKKSQLQD